MIHWKLKYAVILITLGGALLALDASNPFRASKSGSLNINQFAGSYILGDIASGSSSIFVVEKDWTFIWHYGFGKFDGTLMWDGSMLVLETDIEGAITESLVPVRWGARRYLIPIRASSFFSDEVPPFDDQVASFCARIDSGEEPRDRALGRDYLLHGDWEQPISGEPLTSWGTPLCR